MLWTLKAFDGVNLGDRSKVEARKAAAARFFEEEKRKDPDAAHARSRSAKSGHSRDRRFRFLQRVHITAAYGLVAGQAAIGRISLAPFCYSSGSFESRALSRSALPTATRSRAMRSWPRGEVTGALPSPSCPPQSCGLPWRAFDKKRRKMSTASISQEPSASVAVMLSDGHLFGSPSYRPFRAPQLPAAGLFPLALLEDAQTAARKTERGNP